MRCQAPSTPHPPATALPLLTPALRCRRLRPLHDHGNPLSAAIDATSSFESEERPTFEELLAMLSSEDTKLLAVAADAAPTAHDDPHPARQPRCPTQEETCHRRLRVARAGTLAELSGPTRQRWL